jgi:hypothetical protein
MKRSSSISHFPTNGVKISDKRAKVLQGHFSGCRASILDSFSPARPHPHLRRFQDDQNA